jgi:hypothetical protein
LTINAAILAAMPGAVVVPEGADGQPMLPAGFGRAPERAPRHNRPNDMGRSQKKRRLLARRRNEL